MTVCSSLWQSVAVFGILWQPVAVSDCQWQSRTGHGSLWKSLSVCGRLWQFVAVSYSEWQFEFVSIHNQYQPERRRHKGILRTLHDDPILAIFRIFRNRGISKRPKISIHHNYGQKKFWRCYISISDGIISTVLCFIPHPTQR